MRLMMMGLAAAVLLASACDRSFLHDLPEPAPPTSSQGCPSEASPAEVTVRFESEGVTLSWQHRAPAGYETLIERNAENAGFLEVGRAAPGDTSFVDVAADADVDYTYRLRVEGDGCTSEPSEPVSALTPPLPAASLDVSSAVDQLVLSWSDANDHETGYLVTRTQSVGDPAPLESALPADATSFTDTDVDDDTRYFYSVTALGVNGDATPASIEAWTLALAPLDLEATASALPRVSLSWTAAGDDVTDYVIERAIGGSSFSEIAVLAATGTQYDDDDVEEGVSYEYRLMADNPGGRSQSATVTASVPCFEGGEATNLSAVVEAARITLSFASTAPDRYFFVVQRAAGGGAFIDIGQTAAGERSFEDDDVALDTAYRYRVAGNTGACTTGLSAVLNADGLPEAPQLFGVSNAGDDLVLAWTDVSSLELGYKVERSDDGGPFVLLDDTLASSSTVYTDVQPPKDTAFSYRLTAFGQDGDSQPAEATALSRPFAPEGLTVVSAGLDALTVSWTDVNDTETQHVIERALVSDGVFSELAVLGADVVQYADSGLIEGEGYAYRVTAVNAGGASDAAEGTGATNCAVDIDPHTLSVSVVTGKATLTWQSGAEAEYAFAVERSVDDAAFAALATTVDGARTFADDTISLDTRYRYRVRGVFGACQTGLSNVFEAHGLPNAISPPDRDVFETSVVMYLEDPNINETGLRVERSPLGAATFVELDSLAPNSTSYTDDTLVAEQAVDYRIVAVGLSGETVGEIFSVLTLPAAPTDFVVNVTSPSELTLSWTDPNLAETGYRVYRQAPGEGSFTEVTTLSASSTAYSDTDVEEGADYAYRLAAYNPSGESAYAEASGNPGCTPGTAPTDLSAIVRAMEIELAWSSTAPAAYSYRVERSTSGGAFTFVEDTEIAKSFDTTATALDTRYLYRVRAESSYCTSDYSAELQVDGLPNAPGSLGFVASATSITVSWADTNSLETGHRVEARPAGSGAFSVVANVAADVVEADHNGLSPDSQYDYRVIAVGADGEAAATTTSAVGTPPSTPVLTALAAATDAINVVWTSVVPAGSYTLERSNGVGGFDVIAEQSSTTFLDIGLEAGVLYQYRVQAESSKTGLSSGVGSGSATTFSPPSLSAVSVAVDASCNLDFTGSTTYDPAYSTVGFGSASAGLELAVSALAVANSADDTGFMGLLVDDPPHGAFGVAGR